MSTNPTPTRSASRATRWRLLILVPFLALLGAACDANHDGIDDWTGEPVYNGPCNPTCDNYAGGTWYIDPPQVDTGSPPPLVDTGAPPPPPPEIDCSDILNFGCLRYDPVYVP